MRARRCTSGPGCTESQRADYQSDRAFASSYQRAPPAPDARVALDRHGAALARGHRNYPGHPSRGELRATIGYGDLAVKRCPYEAARETVEIFTYLANDLRSEEHTSELQSRQYLVCRLLLEK